MFISSECFMNVVISFLPTADIDVMDTDSDDDPPPMVFVCGKAISFYEVNEEIIAQMTPQEKETYSQVFQETYNSD